MGLAERENNYRKEEEAQAFHGKMAKLYSEDQAGFEAERKREIDALIASEKNEERRRELRKLQEKTDCILNYADC